MSSVQSYIIIILSAQIQPNAAKPTPLHSAAGPKANYKSNPRVSQRQGKEIRYSSKTKSVTRYQPNRACFSITKYKTECRTTHKQAATEGGYFNLFPASENGGIFKNSCNS